MGVADRYGLMDRQTDGNGNQYVFFVITRTQPNYILTKKTEKLEIGFLWLWIETIGGNLWVRL